MSKKDNCKIIRCSGFNEDRIVEKKIIKETDENVKVEIPHGGYVVVDGKKLLAELDKDIIFNEVKTGLFRLKYYPNSEPTNHEVYFVKSSNNNGSIKILNMEKVGDCSFDFIMSFEYIIVDPTLIIKNNFYDSTQNDTTNRFVLDKMKTRISGEIKPTILQEVNCKRTIADAKRESGNFAKEVLVKSLNEACRKEGIRFEHIAIDYINEQPVQNKTMDSKKEKVEVMDYILRELKGVVSNAVEINNVNTEKVIKEIRDSSELINENTNFKTNEIIKNSNDNRDEIITKTNEAIKQSMEQSIARLLEIFSKNDDNAYDNHRGEIENITRLYELDEIIKNAENYAHYQLAAVKIRSMIEEVYYNAPYIKMVLETPCLESDVWINKAKEYNYDIKRDPNFSNSQLKDNYDYCLKNSNYYDIDKEEFIKKNKRKESTNYQTYYAVPNCFRYLIVLDEVKFNNPIKMTNANVRNAVFQLNSIWRAVCVLCHAINEDTKKEFEKNIEGKEQKEWFKQTVEVLKKLKIYKQE